LFLLTAAIVAGLGDLERLVPLEMLSILTGALGAGFCLLTAVVRSGALRWAWAWFGLSVGLNTVGDVLYWIMNRSLSDLALLDSADVLYLSALVPAGIGIIGYPVLTGGRRSWRVL